MFVLWMGVMVVLMSLGFLRVAADYVGKDAHDSPWKHQHTAPEYLEKRRFRRKSGGKVPGRCHLRSLLLILDYLVVD